jgi:hypothetical protein
VAFWAGSSAAPERKSDTSGIPPEGFQPAPGQIYVPGAVLQANLLHQEHPPILLQKRLVFREL